MCVELEGNVVNEKWREREMVRVGDLVCLELAIKRCKYINQIDMEIL